MKRRASSARFGTADKHQKINAVIALSDLHVGSTRGIHPTGFFTKEGNEVSLNPIQEKLLAVWQKSLTDALAYIGDRKFLLLLNGDIIDGMHHKTTQVVSPDVSDHFEASVQLVKPIADLPNCEERIVVIGTNCHVGTSEHSLAKILGAKKPGMKGQSAYNRALFKVNGTLCAATHHFPTTSRPYLEASALSIIMGVARLNAARDGMEVPSVYFWGHRHVPGMYTDGRALGIVNGAFQAKTSYGFKVVPEAVTFPTIAALKFDLPSKLPEAKLFGEPVFEE